MSEIKKHVACCRDDSFSLCGQRLEGNHGVSDYRTTCPACYHLEDFVFPDDFTCRCPVAYLIEKEG